MKKTYNINLSGMVFTMDDDAYDLLNNYLDTLQHAFRHEPDAQELLSDIEGRAAELLCEIPERGRQVVTLTDVESVINRIGRPEDMMEEQLASDTNGGNVETEADTETRRVKAGQAVPPPYNGNGNAMKKLYRDPQTGIIGGVCAGIAAYFNIDVTWVRLFTVAISLLSLSTAAIVYVVLWIILPEARTPLERMQMHGESPTIENIGRTVTDNFKGEQRSTSGEPDNRNGSKRFIDNLAQIFGILAKIALVCLMIVAIPVVIALGIGLLGCLFALILFSTSWGSYCLSELPGMPFESVGQTILGLLTGIGVILVIGIPLAAIIRMVLAKNRPITRGWKRSLIIVWAIGFILGGVSGGLLTAEEERRERQETLEMMRSGKEQTEESERSYDEYVKEIAAHADSIASRADSMAMKADSIAERAVKSVKDVKGAKKAIKDKVKKQD